MSDWGARDVIFGDAICGASILAEITFGIGDERAMVNGIADLLVGQHLAGNIDASKP